MITIQLTISQKIGKQVTALFSL